MAQLIINYNPKNSVQMSYIHSLLGIIDYNKVGVVESTHHPALEEAIKEAANGDFAFSGTTEEFNSYIDKIYAE